ncbi:hypothetical protein [Archangium sp.]|uniref:hypothetical protein n=1 Tax=Archangium sp. TaxID=1872627 RepID=UPI002D63184A|nr:hypothetical protein [Archangium sp.]HYO53006.1 hypothetical protein [Archangium sp.]
MSSSSTDKLLAPDAETLLAPFLACTSPAAFVGLQRGVDMARLVERLNDWSAVRLGALGPVLPRAAEALNRKRASFLVSATQEYGVALAEVFALFVIHSAFDKDLEKVLRQLARLYRTKWPALDMSVSLSFPPGPSGLGVMATVQPLSLFNETERCRQFVEMVRAWASRYPVSHAVAHSVADRALAGAPRFGREQQTSIRDGFDKIYEVFWLNVFGPKLVESVGRQRMLSTPTWRVEELPNGSVLLVTWPTAADFVSEEARLAQARAHVHLRPDLAFDTVLRALRERSAALVPVEPRFHPDVAPLLSRVVDRFAIHERQRKIAELDAWQPPEPKEWLPAEAALHEGGERGPSRPHPQVEGVGSEHASHHLVHLRAGAQQQPPLQAPGRNEVAVLLLDSASRLLLWHYDDAIGPTRCHLSSHSEQGKVARASRYHPIEGEGWGREAEEGR